MGLKHWILPNNHFKTDLFFLIFGWGPLPIWILVWMVAQQKYLGFILSSKGDNMNDIMGMKNKSIYVINKIFVKLKSLNLRKYSFECAMIFLNLILTSSILYAWETFCNLESEIRILERIEECFLPCQGRRFRFWANAGGVILTQPRKCIKARRKIQCC